MKTLHKHWICTAISTSALLISSATAHAAPSENAADRAKEKAAVLAYWTAERIASAQPRDLVVDEKGQWYLRGRDNQLTPYGVGNARPTPAKKPDNPGGGGGGGGKPGGGDDGDTPSNVKNAEWTGGGAVQEAAGRIYFVMDGGTYVCSGTAVDDGSPGGRSIILTAAHCVYDDIAKKFATKATFVPNQAATTGTRTDTDCTNDKHGCWVADFGVVSDRWSGSTWPDNIPWDYAYYAVSTGGTDLNSYLDEIVVPMSVTFDSAQADPNLGAEVNVYTHALGYSYSQDPNFMYCAEPVSHSSNDGWLLSSCGLSGGASGGPWTQSQDSDLGTGPLMSVNSYGPSRGRSYMGGPYLYGNDASCLFDKVRSVASGSSDPDKDYVGC